MLFCKLLLKGLSAAPVGPVEIRPKVIPSGNETKYFLHRNQLCVAMIDPQKI